MTFITKLINWLDRQNPEIGQNAISELPIALRTDRGLVRDENQDRVAVMRVNLSQTTKPFIVIALVDGMGGMNSGSVCATNTIASFFYHLIHLRQEAPMERLKVSALAANKHVYGIAKGKGGATLSAILISEDHQPLFLNLGDSRIYVSAGNIEKRTIDRVTVDDSMEEAVGGYGKELIQFVGMGDGIQPHFGPIPGNASKIVLTSDGTHFLSQKTFYDILLTAPDLLQTVDRIGKVVRWSGAHDNASIAITSLQDLMKSLMKSETGGIELWDPYGALTVMWPNENERDEFKGISKFIKQIRAEQHGNNQKLSNKNESRRAGTKKKRPENKAKVEDRFEYSDNNERIIIINPEDKDATPK